jgi:hypothetical protein
MKDKARPGVKMVMLNGQKNKGKKSKRGENMTLKGYNINLGWAE